MAKLLLPAEVSILLCVSPKTLANWRSRRVGPNFIRLQGGVVRYQASEVDAWLEEQAGRSREWMAA